MEEWERNKNPNRIASKGREKGGKIRDVFVVFTLEGSMKGMDLRRKRTRFEASSLSNEGGAAAAVAATD